MPVWISDDGQESVVTGSKEEIFTLNKPFKNLTKIILIRHGRSDYNEMGLQDSDNKAVLSDLGKKQAKEIAEFL